MNVRVNTEGAFERTIVDVMAADYSKSVGLADPRVLDCREQAAYCRAALGVVTALDC